MEQALRVRPAPRPLALAPPASAGSRARQLFEEAKAAAFEHMRALEASVAAVRDLAAEVGDGGEVYSPGVRDFAKKLSEELFWKAKTLQKLMQT
jgi:hypothetical protein